MQGKRSLVALGLVFLAVIVLFTTAHAGKDHLNVAIQDTLKTMDFYDTSSRVALYSAYMIWDPLLERDPKSGELKPHLVKSWKTPDKNTWEFKIRAGVKFHNGNPLTAESIRFTIEDRILDPERKSPVAGKWKWLKKVEVVDDLTFRFITENPYPLVLQQLNTLFPYDPEWTKAMISKHGEKYLYEHAMGTGPFKLVKYTNGVSTKMVRNEHYWKKGVPAFPEMTIRYIPEMSTRIGELLSGGADCVQIDPDQIPVIERSKIGRVVETPILRIFFWQFDSMARAPKTHKALQDVRVRRAIWHAIDRKAIIDNVLSGHADLIDIPLNPRHFGADTSIKGYEYNPEKARALLKEAGYEGGGGIKLTLWTVSTLHKQANEAAIGYLGQIGIKAVIRDYIGRYGEVAKLCVGGKTDGAYTMSWGSYNIFDPDSILTYFFMKPEAPFNYTNDEELSNWLKTARNTIDEAKRKDLYYKAQKRIVDQVYWMPFFVQHEIQGANKHFQYDLGVDQIPRWQYGSWKE